MYVQSVGKPQGKVQDPRLVPKLELLIKFFITSRPKGEEIAVTRAWRQKRAVQKGYPDRNRKLTIIGQVHTDVAQNSKYLPSLSSISLAFCLCFQWDKPNKRPEGSKAPGCSTCRSVLPDTEQGMQACVLSRSVVSDSLRLHGLQPTKLLCPWDSPGKDAGVGCHALLQEMFLTQGSNPFPVAPALQADSLLLNPAKW